VPVSLTKERLWGGGLRAIDKKGMKKKKKNLKRGSGQKRAAKGYGGFFRERKITEAENPYQRGRMMGGDQGGGVRMGGARL